MTRLLAFCQVSHGWSGQGQGRTQSATRPEWHAYHVSQPRQLHGNNLVPDFNGVTVCRPVGRHLFGGEVAGMGALAVDYEEITLPACAERVDHHSSRG